VPRTGEATDVCSCACDRLDGVCVCESKVGVIDGVTNALAMVPPTILVTVPGAKMRNPDEADTGALPRIKLLAPESKVIFKRDYKTMIKYFMHG
jgi:hypothetical protein